MNTGADDDSLSTPTFAFRAVCELALFISAALTSANSQRLRTALAIVVMNIVPPNGAPCNAILSQNRPSFRGARRAQNDRSEFCRSASEPGIQSGARNWIPGSRQGARPG